MSHRKYTDNDTITIRTEWNDGRVIEDADRGEAGIFRIRGWTNSYTDYSAVIKSISVAIANDETVETHIWLPSQGWRSETSPLTHPSNCACSLCFSQRINAWEHYQA